jgi:hypothetical protein
VNVSLHPTVLALLEKTCNSNRSLLALILLEVKRDAVDTMPLIRRCLVALTFEDMSEMTTTDRQITRTRRKNVAYQLAQVISVRVMNIDLSSCRLTAPGIVSKKAGHPHPEALLDQMGHTGRTLIAYNFWFDLYNGASQPAQARCQVWLAS